LKASFIRRPALFFAQVPPPNCLFSENSHHLRFVLLGLILPYCTSSRRFYFHILNSGFFSFHVLLFLFAPQLGLTTSARPSGRPVLIQYFPPTPYPQPPFQELTPFLHSPHRRSLGANMSATKMTRLRHCFLDARPQLFPHPPDLLQALPMVRTSHAPLSSPFPPTSTASNLIAPQHFKKEGRPLPTRSYQHPLPPSKQTSMRPRSALFFRTASPPPKEPSRFRALHSVASPLPMPPSSSLCATAFCFKKPIRLSSRTEFPRPIVSPPLLERRGSVRTMWSPLGFGSSGNLSYWNGSRGPAFLEEAVRTPRLKSSPLFGLLFFWVNP